MAVIAYATTTRTKRNIEAMKEHGIRLLLTPDIFNDHSMRYMLDNGAWGCFQRGVEWSRTAYERLLGSHGGDADLIVVPDIVLGGLESLRLSEQWLPRLDHFAAKLLIPVQDGMTPEDVEPLCCEQVGIFVGGSTEWKVRSFPVWGGVALRTGCHLHAGRVNTKSRIRKAAISGVHSFDGTSATMFAVNAPKIQRWSSQLGLALTEDW